MQDHFARHHPRLDLTRTVARLELVFASLQRCAIAVEQGQEVEPHRVVDDARALELLGDAAAIVLAHNIDDLVGGERSGLSPLHHQPGDRSDRQKAPTRTKVRNALRLDRVERRRRFGSLAGGGEGSPRAGAGLRPRPNRLARGRGPWPPSLDCPLMPSAGSR